MAEIDREYPIDIVVTWVDGSDPAWRKEKNEWLMKEDPTAADDWRTGEKRFRDWGLLRYWFRAVEECAPWVRTVHFVTWGHVPRWLNILNPKLHVVKHSDFIPEKYLPTFNSHTIELNMHRIPGLAEHFIYFNDDMYFLKATDRDDFFHDGLPRDFVGLDMRVLNREVVDYRPYNAMVINEHFSKDEVIRDHRRLWFSPKYGLKCLMKTVLLMPFHCFGGLQTDHLPISFLKSIFEEVWRADLDMLDSSCRQRFRGEVAVSPWLMRDWQRVEGKFCPKKPQLDASLCCGSMSSSSMGGKARHLATIDQCIDRIEHPSGLGLVCLNDYCETNEEFERWGDALNAAFDHRFPKKSGFEL